MAKLIYTSTGTNLLGNTDPKNDVFLTNGADTLDYQSTGELHIVDVSDGDRINFPGLSGNGFSYKRDGNFITIIDDSDEVVAELGGLNDGEAIIIGYSGGIVNIARSGENVFIGGTELLPDDQAQVDPVEDDTTAPSVTDTTFSVDDDGTAGASVGTVPVSDDTGVTGVSIVAGNDDVDGDSSPAFAIDAGGAITVNDPGDLDAGQQASFSLTVEASDAAGNTGNGTVGVTVLDATPPVVSPSPLNVDENSAAGTVVGNVAGSDNVGVTGWQIVAGNDDVDGDSNPAFAISSTGQITVNDAGDLDFESQSGFNLAVQAGDAAGNTTTAAINVAVNNIDEGSQVPDRPDQGGPGPVENDTAANQNIDGTQGNITQAPTMLTTVGDDRFVIEFDGSVPEVSKSSNIHIQGFDEDDRLFFQDTSDTYSDIAGLDGANFYNVSDNGPDNNVIVSTNTGGTVQSIALVGVAGSRDAAGVGPSIDNLDELNTFFGGAIVEVG